MSEVAILEEAYARVDAPYKKGAEIFFDSRSECFPQRASMQYESDL